MPSHKMNEKNRRTWATAYVEQKLKRDPAKQKRLIEFLMLFIWFHGNFSTPGLNIGWQPKPLKLHATFAKLANKEP